MPSTTAPLAWDKPGQDAIDRRRAFDYNTCAAVACLDSTATTEVVRRHLGGARSVALMQSSGVGNCVNMFSFVKNGQFPMLILVSMRGDFGEGNPWQMPMGQAIQPILETCGFICMRVDQPAEVAATLQAACTTVYQAGQAVAVLLTQRLIGAKAF